MESLEQSAVDKDPARGTSNEAAVPAAVPTTGRSAAAIASSAPPSEAITGEEGLAARGAEAEELDVTAAAAAAAAKLRRARTLAGAESGGEGEADEDSTDDEEGKGDDEQDSGGVVYVPAPTRLPTPP